MISEILNLAANDYKLSYALWNWFLALLPFGLFFYFQRLNGSYQWTKRLLAWPVFFLWLLFLPNSLYITTDIRHVSQPCLWNEYRVCAHQVWHLPLFFFYGLSGYFLFICQLRQFRFWCAEKYSPLAAYFALFPLVFLAALGVLLGLVERHNSWEIFYNLAAVKASIMDYLFLADKLSIWIAWSLLTLASYALGEIFLYFSRRLNN